jgi:hypothetical protein
MALLAPLSHLNPLCDTLGRSFSPDPLSSLPHAIRYIILLRYLTPNPFLHYLALFPRAIRYILGTRCLSL